MSVFLHGHHYGVYTPPHATSVLVTAPEFEPLTLEEAKLRAGQDWEDGDPRDALMESYIAAARAKVEQDTGLALPEQTRDIYLDRMPGNVLELPALSRPLQSVTSIKTFDTDGNENTLDPSNYTVDVTSGRISLSETGAWPTDLRTFRPWTIRIVSGWPAAAEIPPLLVFAVGLLCAHYMTAGRDAVSSEGYQPTPLGYESAIAPHVLVTVV